MRRLYVGPLGNIKQLRKAMSAGMLDIFLAGFPHRGADDARGRWRYPQPASHVLGLVGGSRELGPRSRPRADPH